MNNVHKSERFLKPGTTTVVSTFGPVCFGKSPCLLLRQQKSEGELPVPCGSLNRDKAMARCI